MIEWRVGQIHGGYLKDSGSSILKYLSGLILSYHHNISASVTLSVLVHSQLSGRDYDCNDVSMLDYIDVTINCMQFDKLLLKDLEANDKKYLCRANDIEIRFYE